MPGCGLGLGCGVAGTTRWSTCWSKSCASFFLQPRYPEEIAGLDEDALAAHLIEQAARERWGALGEVGSSFPAMHDDERRMIRAVSQVHRRTGLPIFTHVPSTRRRASTWAGYEDHILLSSDFANTAQIKANWGNGFSTVLVQFVPKLRYYGVPEETIRKILVDNPRRWLAHVPGTA